jgi:hypothetical protein
MAQARNPKMFCVHNFEIPGSRAAGAALAPE